VEGSKEEGLGLLLRGSPTSVFPNWAIFDLKLQEDIEDENDKKRDLQLCNTFELNVYAPSHQRLTWLMDRNG